MNSIFKCPARHYLETTHCAFSSCAYLCFCICVPQCAFTCSFPWPWLLPLTMAPGRSRHLCVHKVWTSPWSLWRLPQRALACLPMYWRLLEFLTPKEDCKDRLSPVSEVGSPSHSTPKTPVVNVNSAQVSRPEHHGTCPVVLESSDQATLPSSGATG